MSDHAARLKKKEQKQVKVPYRKQKKLEANFNVMRSKENEEADVSN